MSKSDPLYAIVYNAWPCHDIFKSSELRLLASNCNLPTQMLRAEKLGKGLGILCLSLLAIAPCSFQPILSLNIG